MRQFFKKVRVASASGAITLLIATTSMQVTAESGFSTDVEADQSRVPAIQRAANSEPTTVVDSAGALNGNTSLQDAAGGIATVINKGAEKTSAQVRAAEVQISNLRKELKKLGTKAGSATTDEVKTEVKTNIGYTTRTVRDGCIAHVWSGPNGMTSDCVKWSYSRTYRKCKQSDTYISGVFVRSTIKEQGSWSKKSSSSPFPGAQCSTAGAYG